MTNHRSPLVYFTACLLLFSAFAAKHALAQSITGGITGNVVDTTGAAIPNAAVTLTSDATNEVRKTTANETGTFGFTAVQPGSYSLKVERDGFKAQERTGIRVAATEHVAVGNIQLEVGAVSSTIVVEAETEHVSTDSSQVTGEIDSDQLRNLTARGRDVVSMLRVVPGVSYQADQDSAGGTYGTSTPSIMGSSANTNHIAIDGVTSNDQGSPSVFSSATMLDAIGEVKVVLNSYQAEYAGNGGSIVQVVTKSGTNEYHGTLYEFNRNEDYNANSFFNNRNGVAKARYRYNTLGGTLGGPIYVPGHWNRSKTKLFGFYNMDIQLIARPGSLSDYTMPTAIERNGDFSQTLDVSGKLIPVNDPLNGSKQFTGNVIPVSRLNSNGLALMNILPLPNYTNRAITLGNYNYQIQETIHQPTRAQVFKIDYVPTDKDRFYVRGKTYLSQDEGYAVSGGSTPIGLFGQCYCFTESGLAIVGTHIFSPTVVLEYNTGVRHNHEAWHPYGENGRTNQEELDRVTRSKIGYGLGQWFPQSNPDNWIPRYSFGGVPDAPNVSYDSRLLKGGTDFGFNADSAVSITHGNHLFKIGADFLRDREYEGETSTFSGTFSFAKDTNNPFDTDYAFSNAALGYFDNYSESNARYGANLRQSTMEWFVQDTWKVSRRLTINAGIRWSFAQQPYNRYDGQAAQFAPSLYNAASVPPLLHPVIVNGKRQAQNPLTGALLPAAYIGTFAPGVGDPASGSVLSGASNYPRGFVNQWGILQGPRLGFSWDPFGKGKTAVRGGAAILYTIRASTWGNIVNRPPAVFTPIAYYGDMSTFLESAGALSPGSTSGQGINNKAPDSYNLSFGIQQDLGRGFLMDVSYAGTLGQHEQQGTNIEAVPVGTRFLPQNQDPTSPGKPLPNTFIQPIPGYSGITIYNNAYNSNYHSLLTTINRRAGKHLRMGLSYTFSKYLDYTGIPAFNNLRTWSYGFDGADSTHNVAINYVYDVPNLTNLVGNHALARFVGNGWTLTGISQFVSGTPASISFSTVQGTDLTGGGDGQRVMVVGDPNANGSTFNAWFNPAAFALPPGNSSGNASKNSVRNPGVNNDDMTVSKQFALKSEKRYIQFRWEAYNVFNHTQYSSINTSAKYDLTTGAQTNAQFGQVTGARSNRVMQGVLRLVF